MSIAASAQVDTSNATVADAEHPATVLSGSTRIYLNMPAFGAIGFPLCDASGDIYFNVGVEAGQFGPFLRIKGDGSSHTLFDLPYEERDWGAVRWTVAPDGTFYVLHISAKRHAFRLIRYRKDATVADISEYSIPWDTGIQHLAINDSGVLYVAGYRKTQQSDNEPRAGYAALFSPSGKLIADLSQRADQVRLDIGHTPEGGVTAANDGRFYVLGSKTITVINQTGELERTLTFQKPTRESFPARIDFSQGALSIGLETVRERPGMAPSLETRTLVLDAQSGEQLGSYTFDPKLTGTTLCFNRTEGYSMMARDPSKEAIEWVPIR